MKGWNARMRFQGRGLAAWAAIAAAALGLGFAEVPAGRGARGGGAARRAAGSTSNVFVMLLAGGVDPANNHQRYWNDLGLAYHLFKDDKGCPADNIYVLYADGKGRDTDVPVDAAAT